MVTRNTTYHRENETGAARTRLIRLPREANAPQGWPVDYRGRLAPAIYLRASGARRAGDDVVVVGCPPNALVGVFRCLSFPPNALVGVFRELQAGLHRAQTGEGGAGGSKSGEEAQNRQRMERPTNVDHRSRWTSLRYATLVVSKLVQLHHS